MASACVAIRDVTVDSPMAIGCPLSALRCTAGQYVNTGSGHPTADSEYAHIACLQELECGICPSHLADVLQVNNSPCTMSQFWCVSHAILVMDLKRSGPLILTFAAARVECVFIHEHAVARIMLFHRLLHGLHRHQLRRIQQQQPERHWPWTLQAPGSIAAVTSSSAPDSLCGDSFRPQQQQISAIQREQYATFKPVQQSPRIKQRNQQHRKDNHCCVIQQR